MQVKSHDALWDLDRKIYAFKDLVLWVPVRVKATIAFLAASVVWVPAVLTFNLTAIVWWDGRGAAGMRLIVLFGLPTLVGWATGRELVDGRTLDQVAVSWVRWRLSPPTLVGMDVPEPQPDTLPVYAETWTPRPTRMDRP